MDTIRAWVDLNFALYFAIAAGWTTLFSMTIKPGIRGLRNLGILASYILFPISLFSAPFVKSLVTWCAFGVIAGIAYICYDILLRLTLPKTEEPKHEISLSHIFYGQIAWPIMLPEAIENSLAQLGLLRKAKPRDPVEVEEELKSRESQSNHADEKKA